MPLDTHKSAKEHLSSRLWALQVRFPRNLLLSMFWLLILSSLQSQLWYFTPLNTPSVSDSIVAEWLRLKMLLKYFLHLPMMSSSLLSWVRHHFVVMDLATSDVFLRRRRMLFQWLESTLCPKLSLDCILDSFATRTADFPASAYDKCKEASDLFWSSGVLLKKEGREHPLDSFSNQYVMKYSLSLNYKQKYPSIFRVIRKR